MKNANDPIKSLESSILRLQSIQRLTWQTAILLVPSSVCCHLSRLASLRLLRLEQQGEYMGPGECRGFSIHKIIITQIDPRNACPLLCGKSSVLVDSRRPSVSAYAFYRCCQTHAMKKKHSRQRKTSCHERAAGDGTASRHLF